MPSRNETFEGIIVAVDINGHPTLVGGDGVWKLQNYLGPDEGLAEYIEYDNHGFPEDAGIYRCTIEYYFNQGYFEGYSCDSESDWGVVCHEAEKITIEDK